MKATPKQEEEESSGEYIIVHRERKSRMARVSDAQTQSP